MEQRKLTENEYKYLWYIEYGDPYHYIGTPPEIGEAIKNLIDDGICIMLPNPTKEGSPLYCRFTRQGRMLFLAHEWVMLFRHPSELEEGVTYESIVGERDFKSSCVDLGCRLYVEDVLDNEDIDTIRQALLSEWSDRDTMGRSWPEHDIVHEKLDRLQQVLAPEGA